MPNPFKKGVRKEFAGGKFFPYREDPFPEEDKTIVTVFSPESSS